MQFIAQLLAMHCRVKGYGGMFQFSASITWTSNNKLAVNVYFLESNEF